MTDEMLAATDAADTAEETVNTAELLALFDQRAATYGLLSRLFSAEVDEALLDELHATPWPVHTGNDLADEGNRLIATYLSGLWENTLTELAADYMRTFFGHGYSGHAAAYPFESVYTSEKRLLMQSARDEVLALYRAAGLSKKDSWKEGEDHIALELEYLQVLSARVAQALRAGNADEALAWVRSSYNFIDVHLAGWVPLLTAEVDKFAKTDFYRGLAFLTEGFLETDRELLEDMLSED